MLLSKRCWQVLMCLTMAQATFAITAFNPLEFKKQTAHCKAVRRAQTDEVVSVDLKYVDINPEGRTTLLMVHGWPSLWSTWSNQIQEFRNDYRLVVVELRGFGESQHPGNPHSSGTIGDMVDDLKCMLQHAKVESAICMGHDWGSSICYEAARLRPDIFSAVIGAAIPYIPAAGPFLHVKTLVPRLPKLAYQLFFDSDPDAAAKELEKDPRRTIRATLRTVDSPPPEGFLKSNDSFLKAWEDVEEIPPVPFFSAEEETYFVEQYKLSGFKNTLQFYSQFNRLQQWTLAHTQGNHTIPQPTLAVYPLQDPVADWISTAKILKSADYLPDLTIETLPGAHWFHLEHPKEFNKVVRRWLERDSVTSRKFGDEL